MKPIIPPAVLAQHLGIFGKTGRGKSTTAKVCVEQVYHEDFRVCILDPIKSDWWGLTSSADGKRAGLPFHILGGPHAHVPLASSSGKAIADLVARGQLRHTIIDMAEFEPGGQLRWFVDFAPRLLQRMKGVLYLVIEEAHLFAPKERVGMGHENMAIHWAKMLATAGRTKGIRLIVLSQRTQSLHNAVIGSCDSMIVHGFTAPADMDPLIKWIKANTKDKALVATIEGSLSGLKTGTGWLCSSEAGIFALQEFPKASTYDNTATPEDDSELAEVAQAPVNLEALRAILGKAVAEAEASDPRLLHKRIAELEAALLAHEKNPSGPSVRSAHSAGYALAEDRYKPLMKEQWAEAYTHGSVAGGKQVSEIALEFLQAIRQDAHNRIQQYMERIEKLPPPYIPDLEFEKELAELPSKPAKAPKPAVYKVEYEYVGKEFGGTAFSDAILADVLNERSARDPSAPAAIAVAGDGVALINTARPGSKPLPAPAQKVLNAVYWLWHKGIQRPTRQQVSVIAKLRGGNFTNLVGLLRRWDYLTSTTNDGTLQITEQGKMFAQYTSSDTRPLHQRWMDAMSGSQRRIFEHLVEIAPEPISRQYLSEAVGLSGGNFTNLLGSLHTMGAIDYPQKGVVQVSKATGLLG